MARALYTLALYLLLPAIGLRLGWRARHQPEYLRHLGERFGRYDKVLPAKARAERAPIWIHAVSVGETRAAQPLVNALLARYPEHPILLTHMTPTGRQTSGELFGDRVLRAYLPYDYPFAVRAFLRHFQPALGILMETELWPNLLAASRAKAIPVVLVNARLSEKSAAGYRRVAGLARQCLHDLGAIAAQSDADARRLTVLGASDVAVLGNLKFDIAAPPAQVAAGRALRARIGARGVLLAASTREGEEALILDAFAAAPRGDMLLVIVPRHPQRFDPVAQLIAGRRLKLQRRSEEGAVEASTQVLLGDSMGEMFAYCAASDVAFIGGSLLPLGGQNLIEACAVGAPVLVGPHTFNFAQATDQAIAAGAARRIGDARELLQEAEGLLGDAEARRAMGEAGTDFAARHRGATQKTLELIARFLPH